MSAHATERRAYVAAYELWRKGAGTIPPEHTTLRAFGGYCARVLRVWGVRRPRPTDWRAAAAHLAKHPYSIPGPEPVPPHMEMS